MLELCCRLPNFQNSKMSAKLSGAQNALSASAVKFVSALKLW